MADHVTPAHKQSFTHRYIVSYPEHYPRKDDPNYVDFEAYRRRTKKDAVCVYAVQTGNADECDHDHPMELHHAHIEFAMQNEVDLKLLERAYPGVSDPDKVGPWVESGTNLEWRCRMHHRGHKGVHCATQSDYEAERFIRNLIS